ncbi:MarR family winged helix-turn-helix transcriptional regulator [Flexithrix dorotheae]|uniref:MarR family winged helix-turn-helix transcriptional regulator n=1 Tax=Flexithrix dorotheae TaxID=70993 RepID=UPI00037F10C0|nr:MarR family winged helix-turn-helix transcriptional regulator [Flexithrix dorotheae]
MNFEEEIKQYKFSSVHQKAMLNLMFTGNWVNSLNAKFFKQYNLSPQQFNILRILRGQYPRPASINLLMERMLDRMSNASRLVEKLRQKGLVGRHVCKDDRRQVDVKITAKGLDLLKEIENSPEKIEFCCSNLSVEELKQLSYLLDKLRG